MENRLHSNHSHHFLAELHKLLPQLVEVFLVKPPVLPLQVVAYLVVAVLNNLLPHFLEGNSKNRKHKVPGFLDLLRHLPQYLHLVPQPQLQLKVAVFSEAPLKPKAQVSLEVLLQQPLSSPKPAYSEAQLQLPLLNLKLASLAVAALLGLSLQPNLSLVSLPSSSISNQQVA